MKTSFQAVPGCVRSGREDAEGTAADRLQGARAPLLGQDLRSHRRPELCPARPRRQGLWRVSAVGEVRW